jgi:MinD superfamily P-loop ATPase
LTLKLRDGLRELSEPEKVEVCVVGGGGGAGVTTLVAAELAVVEPPLFEAVTATRSVYPTSLFCAVKLLFAAPAIAAQLAPLVSQSCHW